MRAALRGSKLWWSQNVHSFQTQQQLFGANKRPDIQKHALCCTCSISVAICMFGKPQNIARKIHTPLPLHLLFSISRYPVCSHSAISSILLQANPWLANAAEGEGGTVITEVERVNGNATSGGTEQVGDWTNSNSAQTEKVSKVDKAPVGHCQKRFPDKLGKMWAEWVNKCSSWPQKRVKPREATQCPTTEECSSSSQG